MSQPQVAPARLRALTSWQAGRVATLGARLTAAHMALEARSDFAVLAALDELGPLSQAEIGRSLGLDRANVNRIASRLEQEGLLARTQDPEDGRRQVLRATAEGQAHLADLERSAGRVQDELLVALDRDERDQLRLLLDKVLAAHPAQPA